MRDKHFPKLKWINALSIVYLCCTWRCVESACPEGYKERGDNCCLPTTCSINQGYRLCNGLRGRDSCYACPPGTVSQVIVNTADFNYELLLCKEPSCNCPPEGILLNEHECLTTGMKDCQCDRQRGYYGYDVNICPRVNATVLSQIQRPGYELKLDGKILPCEKGYFKDRPDNSTCVLLKRCREGFKIVSDGSTTHDRVCQKIVGPKTSSSFPSTEEKHVTSVSQSSISAMPIPSSDNDDTIATYLIIIICLSACLVILVLVSCMFLLYLKCKGRRLDIWNWIQNIRQKCSCSHHTAVPTYEPEQQTNVHIQISENEDANCVPIPEITHIQPDYSTLDSTVGVPLDFGSLLNESEQNPTQRMGNREHDQGKVNGHSRIPVEHEEQTNSSQI